ncbi:hypothetical protein GCM10009540_68830 [Streptomyces turgidiscabies]
MGDLAQRLKGGADTAHEVRGIGQMPDEGGAHELVVLDHEHTCHAPHRTPIRRVGSGACGQLRADRARTPTGDTCGAREAV